MTPTELLLTTLLPFNELTLGLTFSWLVELLDMSGLTLDALSDDWCVLF